MLALILTCLRRKSGPLGVRNKLPLTLLVAVLCILRSVSPRYLAGATVVSDRVVCESQELMCQLLEAFEWLQRGIQCKEALNNQLNKMSFRRMMRRGKSRVSSIKLSSQANLKNTDPLCTGERILDFWKRNLKKREKRQFHCSFSVLHPHRSCLYCSFHSFDINSVVCYPFSFFDVSTVGQVLYL